MFLEEKIEDSHKLYCRVHRNNVRDNELLPIVFRERGEGEKKGMSVDWEKYATPEDTRNRATSAPIDNGIIQFIAGNVREIGLTVVHAPEDYNRAHSNIKGIESIRERLLASDIYTWVINFA